MRGHATRKSVSCVISSKKKILTVKKIIQYWIGSVGYPKKILRDNGGELADEEIKTLCENVNITI